MKKSLFIFFIISMSFMTYGQTNVQETATASITLKAGPTFINYPFSLPGFNNALSTGSANSVGFMLQADVILKKKWLGLITSLYFRANGSYEAFYKETYSLTEFSSGLFISRGVFTGFYFEKSFAESFLQSVYAKTQAGAAMIQFPLQELSFDNDFLNSVRINEKQSAAFVANVGIGTRFKAGEKISLLAEINSMTEIAELNTEMYMDYTDDIPENILTNIEWNQWVFNFNIGIAYTF